MTSELEHRVERLVRDLAPQVLGAMVRRYRDFASSEDAVQEALIAAVAQWPREGIPGNPRGWLVQVAQRRMVDQLRSEASRRNRESAVALTTPLAVAPSSDGEPEMDPDDTLVLLFMCCHPALTPASAIALTLRAVGGLTTPEIAKAFLVPDSTIGQRISRAKHTIKTSGIAFRMPVTLFWHASSACTGSSAKTGSFRSHGHFVRRSGDRSSPTPVCRLSS